MSAALLSLDAPFVAVGALAADAKPLGDPTLLFLVTP